MSDKNQEAARLIREVLGEQAPEGACLVFALVASKGQGPVSGLSNEVRRLGYYSAEFCEVALPVVVQTLAEMRFLKLEHCREGDMVFWGDKGLALSREIGPEVHQPALWQMLARNR